MPITFPLTLPSDPKPVRFQLRQMNAVALGRSQFTFQAQAQKHAGELWSAEVSFDPMERFEAEPWIAKLQSLDGRFGTFLLPVYDAPAPRGSVPGAPVVDGAAQTGRVLLTRGWTASQTGILLAGDYLTIGSGLTTRLYKVPADVNSDALGKAAVDIWPRLRESPADGAAIVTANTKVVCRLAGNETAWDVDAALFYGFGFSAVEAI